MSVTEIQVAYDSVDPKVHTMDVEQLAPSLLAIGNLCKRANALINGDLASVKVLVESDFEHKCFLINFQVVQDIFQQVQHVLHQQDVKSAKEILEWVGLIQTGLGGYGLFKYLKEKRGREPISIKKTDNEGTVEIKFEGDNNVVHVHQNVLKLSDDAQVIGAVKGVLQPTQTPGITAVEFRQKGRAVETVDKAAAAQIIAAEPTSPPAMLEQELAPQVIDARLTIYSPVFDEGSRIWKFTYGDRVIQVDVHDSGIAEDVFRRGRVSIGDAYLVKLEITEHKTPTGQFRNTYRALSFSRFLPASTQLPLIPRGEDDAERSP